MITPENRAEAERLAVEVMNEQSYHPFHNGKIDSASAIIAQALQAAEARGRDKGLEEAENAVNNCPTMASKIVYLLAIRNLMDKKE